MSEKKVYLAFIGKMAITTFKMIQNEKVGDVLDICYKMGTKIELKRNDWENEA